MAVDEIDALLAERLQCKFRRDFQRADALQEECLAWACACTTTSCVGDDGGGFGDEMGRNAKAEGNATHDRTERRTRWILTVMAMTTKKNNREVSGID